MPSTEVKAGEEARIAVAKLIQQLPGRLRKKMFAIRSRIEWMVEKYGIEHVGLQTLTIRENVTDRKEFTRRFKSLATNVFPKIYEDWLRVFERQQCGAWHAHVVVVTKEDIRTGCNVAALNQLFKDNKEHKITKGTYYAGIHRLASPNLRAIWGRSSGGCAACGSSKHGAKPRAGDTTSSTSATCCQLSAPLRRWRCVSKYIAKTFENRRAEDKGMRLVGCSKRVAKVCNERFSWANGAGSLRRTKLAIVADMLRFETSDDFAKSLGPKWAYHLKPVIELLSLPHYGSMKLARADGWDLVSTSDGSPWPWPDLDLPKADVQASRMQAFLLARQLLARQGRKQEGKRRALGAWDPEQREGAQDVPRVFKVFRPPPEPAVLTQGELPGTQSLGSWANWI